MLDLRTADVLLSCFIIFISVNSPSTGQAGGDCSCNSTNSRCDEVGVCRCDPGWDGEHCERCVPTPGCVHGSCLQPWQCSCEPGWAGRFCDKDLSKCEQRPCLNGATCRMEDSGDFSCLCLEGFHGQTCERRVGPCSRHRSPCKNGGLCEDGNGFAAELTCQCLAGFTGPRCATDLDDCQMSPCANGATCLDSVNRFSCVCLVGFTGRFCTINLDDCVSRPCQNAARCLDLAGGFRCVCRPGFTGHTCELPLKAPEAPLEDGSIQRSPTTTAGHHGNGLLKVTVSERGGDSISQLQLIALLLFTGVTLALVALSATLVLQGHCGGGGGHAHFGSSRTSSRIRRKGVQDDLKESQDNFLNAAEPETKKHEVV